MLLSLRTALSTLCLLALTQLAGCALSPQTVAVRPDLDVPSMPIGKGRAVSVTTRDLRSDSILGSRGGIYQTATLSTDARMEQSITQEAVRVLQSWDFVAAPANLSRADAARFTVEVIDIDYRKPATNVAGNISVKCRVGVRVEMGAETYRGEYASQRTEQVVVTSTASGNQRMVNDTISQALNQIFLDSKLQRFMAR